VVGNPNGRQFKVGYAINGQVVGGKTGGVADAGWRTDGNETTVFDVNGSHTDGFDLTGATLTGAALKLAAAHTLVVGGVNTRILPSGLRPAGALYETLERDKNAFTNNALLVSQRLQMVAIDLPAGLTVTSISVQSGTTALVTGAHQIFGLYDDSLGSSSATPRALLRGSSDDTSTAWGSNTVKTLTLTSTYTTTRAGLFYIGVLVDAATPPTLWIGATIGSGPQGVAPIVAGSSSTGVTALPNPAAALTANNAMFWAWVN
jgi:hypothetical protein